MKLFYCIFCGMVAAFNLDYIRHTGERMPADRRCPVCEEDQAYTSVEEVKQ